MHRMVVHSPSCFISFFKLALTCTELLLETDGKYLCPPLPPSKQTQCSKERGVKTTCLNQPSSFLVIQPGKDAVQRERLRWQSIDLLLRRALAFQCVFYKRDLLLTDNRVKQSNTRSWLLKRYCGAPGRS